MNGILGTVFLVSYSSPDVCFSFSFSFGRSGNLFFFLFYSFSIWTVVILLFFLLFLYYCFPLLSFICLFFFTLSSFDVSFFISYFLSPISLLLGIAPVSLSYCIPILHVILLCLYLFYIPIFPLWLHPVFYYPSFSISSEFFFLVFLELFLFGFRSYSFFRCWLLQSFTLLFIKCYLFLNSLYFILQMLCFLSFYFIWDFIN